MFLAVGLGTLESPAVMAFESQHSFATFEQKSGPANFFFCTCRSASIAIYARLWALSRCRLLVPAMFTVWDWDRDGLQIWARYHNPLLEPVACVADKDRTRASINHGIVTPPKRKKKAYVPSFWKLLRTSPLTQHSRRVGERPGLFFF
jgi:hypothetical protein